MFYVSKFVNTGLPGSRNFFKNSKISKIYICLPQEFFQNLVFRKQYYVSYMNSVEGRLTIEPEG